MQLVIFRCPACLEVVSYLMNDYPGSLKNVKPLTAFLEFIIVSLTIYFVLIKGFMSQKCGLSLKFGQFLMFDQLIKCGHLIKYG